jgi:hypothetical protein
MFNGILKNVVRLGFEPKMEQPPNDDEPDYSQLINHTDPLPEGWSPCVVGLEGMGGVEGSSGSAEKEHTRPQRNNREKHLNKGYLRAKEILSTRDEAVNAAGNVVDKISTGIMTFGAWTAPACPPIGFGIMALGTVAKFSNDAIVSYGLDRIKKAENALDICKDIATTEEAKKEAAAYLKKTAIHMRYWENSTYAVSTLVKFAVGQVSLLFDAGKEILEVVEHHQHENGHKTQKDINPAKRFNGAIGLVIGNRPSQPV